MSGRARGRKSGFLRLDRREHTRKFAGFFGGWRRQRSGGLNSLKKTSGFFRRWLNRWCLGRRRVASLQRRRWCHRRRLRLNRARWRLAGKELTGEFPGFSRRDGRRRRGFSRFGGLKHSGEFARLADFRRRCRRRWRWRCRCRSNWSGWGRLRRRFHRRGCPKHPGELSRLLGGGWCRSRRWRRSDGRGSGDGRGRTDGRRGRSLHGNFGRLGTQEHPGELARLRFRRVWDRGLRTPAEKPFKLVGFVLRRRWDGRGDDGRLGSGRTIHLHWRRCVDRLR